MRLKQVLMIALALALAAVALSRLPGGVTLDSLQPPLSALESRSGSRSDELAPRSEVRGELTSRLGRAGAGEAESDPRQALDSRPAAAPPERDELFSDSPAPPAPGDYDGELVLELNENGLPLFEAQQSQREDGVWVVDGRWTSWHDNGQVREVGEYSMGAEVGDWSWFEDNGQRVAVGTFVEGQREGAWTFWYSNGVKQMDARYEGGEGSGNWLLYYEDGSPWAEGSYVDGEISGYWTIWDEFGAVNPERSGVYEHGERVSD
jgi:hypothetical protein